MHTLLRHPKFPFCGEINEDSVSDCVQWLTDHHAEKDLTILLASSGGLVKYALAAYDTINLMAGATNIHVLATGRCESAATVILAAADRDKRYATPHTTFLTHSIGTTKDGVRHPCVEDVSDPETIKAMSQLAGVNMSEAYRLQDVFVKIYRERAGLTEEKARSLLTQEDRVFTAAEALDLGFVRHIVQRSEPTPKRPSRWRKILGRRS